MEGLTCSREHAGAGCTELGEPIAEQVSLPLGIW
jgi:hypothetical protein